MGADLRLVALVGLLTGCVPSLRSDLSRIEQLTAQRLPREVLGEVDLGEPADVSRALREPLTVDGAVRLALANNREIRASLRDLGVERGLLAQAHLLPNPEVEIDLRRQEDLGQPLQVELYVEYPLTHALLTPMRVEAAGHDLEAARHRAAGRVLQLAYEARAAYLAAQAAEQSLAVAQRSLEALAAARDAAQMLYEAGNTAALDVATQVAAYEEARAVVAQIELERASTRERLARALGLHGAGLELTMAGTLPDVPPGDELPETLEREALTASLELAETRSRLAALAQRVGLSRTEGWLPEISVDVHAEQDGETWEYGGGASLSIPLFDRREGETAAFQARFDALTERYLGAAVDVRSAAREARNRLTSARLRATQYAAVIVPARGRVVEQTLLQYDAMQVGVFELLAALRAQLSAELEGIAARRDYWTARAALDALLRGQRVSFTGGASATLASDPGTEGGH